MALILLRHSPADAPPGTCYGSSDVGLAADFPEHAHRVRAMLPPLGAIRSSPLSRCARLAGSIAAAQGLRVVIDPNLAEMNFGTWELTPWDAIPRDQIDAWAADFMDARPPGGESVRDLAGRAARARDTADAAAARTQGPVLLVTHAGMIRAFWAASGVAGAWQAAVPYATPLTLDGAPWSAQGSGHPAPVQHAIRPPR